MNSFVFNDAIRFKLVTQQEDTSAKLQVFLGVFIGVLLRWVYAVAVVVIKTQGPWCFGDWTTIILRVAVALGVTFFVFSGYWGQVKDEPPSMFAKLELICSKCIGDNQLCTSLNVGTMDFCHCGWVCKVKLIKAFIETDAVGMEHGSHRTVGKNGLGSKEIQKFAHCFLRRTNCQFVLQFIFGITPHPIYLIFY